MQHMEFVNVNALLLCIAASTAIIFSTQYIDVTGKSICYKKIGEGANGVISQALYIKNFSIIAVKKSKDYINGINESVLLKKLNHPSIIKLLSNGQKFDRTTGQMLSYLEMEYADRDIRNISANETMIRNIAKSILGALEYMHGKNIIHRDIKPQNIVLVGNIAKLCDFGCSVQNDKNECRTQCGSWLFMSPEMIKSKPYNEKIDIWSFGITLYLLLYKKFPFYDNDYKNLCQRIINGKFDTDSSIYEQANDLLMRMIDTEHSTRWSAKECLKHSWFVQECNSI